MKQTYDNYFRDYFKTPAGRASKLAANRKYKQKLAESYGVGQNKAVVLHREKKKLQMREYRKTHKMSNPPTQRGMHAAEKAWLETK